MKSYFLLLCVVFCACSQKAKPMPQSQNAYKVVIYGRDLDATGSSAPISEIQILEVNDSAAYGRGFSEFLISKSASDKVEKALGNSHLQTPQYFTVYNSGGSDISNHIDRDLIKKIEVKISTLVK